MDKTLTDEEISAACAKLTQAAASVGAAIRG
jgi:phenylalanyl-tRNA synthetase beta subunit